METFKAQLPMVDIVISYSNVTLLFTNCLFYENQFQDVLPLIKVHDGFGYVSSVDHCTFPSNIKIEHSRFIANKCPLVKIEGNRNSKNV